MKATKEQVLAMAMEAFELIEGDDINCHAELKTLVHLAQQFTLDQIRDQGMADVDTSTGQPLYHIPETLE